MYKEMQPMVRELLHKAEALLSFTQDEWTAPNSLPFKCITVHFVDDKWRLRSLVLGFEPLEGSHTGQYLLEVFQNVLSRREWNLGTERLFSVTMDNATNNTSFGEAARHRKRLRRQLRIPLLAHIINLAARRLISHTECDKVAEKLRKVSRWVGQNGNQQSRIVTADLEVLATDLL